MSPSDSIIAVPGRSKIRVESSNPVPRGNSVHKSSKVRRISEEEAIRLTVGAAISPLATSGIPVPAQRTPDRPPKPALRQGSAKRKHNSSGVSFVLPMSVSSQLTPEAVPVPAPAPSPSPSPARGRKAPRVASDQPRKPIVLALAATSVSNQFVRRRSSPSRVQSRTVETPLDPRLLKVASRIKEPLTANATSVVPGTSVDVVGATAATATQVVQGTTVKVGDRTKKVVRDLVEYRPARLATWMGRIVGSAGMPEYCEFKGTPASNIAKQAYKLLIRMPKILEGDVLRTSDILKDVFGRSPMLSDVVIYFFPEEKETERFKRLYAPLLDGSALIRVDVKGKKLLIFSSNVLDPTSQYAMKEQKETEIYLWGCFLPLEKYQTPLDNEDSVGMDIDAEPPNPSVAVELIKKLQVQVKREVSSPPRDFKNLSISPVRPQIDLNSPPGFENPPRSPVRPTGEVGVPPGYENIWTAPPVKLNIQGTSNPASGFAGVVRDLSGKWLFGFSRCHKGLNDLGAELLAMYSGLSLLWDTGFRDIRLETSSQEIIVALRTNSSEYLKKHSILERCRDVLLKDWECYIYPIAKEQNSCAEWLAGRVGEQPQGLLFYEYPPRGLINLLEQDRVAALP